MQKPRFKAEALRLSLAAVFAAGFVFCGAKQVGPALRDGSIHSPAELHSCDLYLEYVTHRPGFAAKYSEALRTLPSGKPIAIIMREEDPASSLLGMLSAYLGWPHAVRIFRIDRNPSPFLPEHYVAIVYCNLSPGPNPRTVVTVSDNLHVAISSSP
jgi:hypothetical protein